MAAMALRSFADLAWAVATGGLRTNQRSVRSSAKDLDVPTGVHPWGRQDLSHYFELIFGSFVDHQWPLPRQDRQKIEAPLPPFRIDLVRLCQGNQMSNRPGDN